MLAEDERRQKASIILALSSLLLWSGRGVVDSGCRRDALLSCLVDLPSSCHCVAGVCRRVAANCELTGRATLPVAELGRERIFVGRQGRCRRANAAASKSGCGWRCVDSRLRESRLSVWDRQGRHGKENKQRREVGRRDQGWGREQRDKAEAGWGGCKVSGRRHRVCVMASIRMALPEAHARGLRGSQSRGFTTRYPGGDDHEDHVASTVRSPTKSLPYTILAVASILTVLSCVTSTRVAISTS